MSLLWSSQGLSKSYGTVSLFEEISFSIFEGDHLGLIGLNGSGKSTLLKIIAGLETSDQGTIAPKKDLTIGYVAQSFTFPDVPVEELFLSKISPHVPDYERDRIVSMQMKKFGFKGDEPSASLLSGGWKKRLQIALELLSAPDLLLLDEPTNHLDLEGVLWLEKFLQEERLTYVVVSHDRYFLQHVTNRVMELNRMYPQGVFSIDAPYEEFLSQKQAFIQGQLEQEKRIATKARRETQWLRAGVKARTTKSQSRIDMAEQILEEHAAISSRNTQKRARIAFAATERETRKLIVAKNLAKEIGGKALFRSLDLTLSPGMRVALMGPNGCGKTTLLRMFAEETLPDMGTIKKAEGLQIVYFDQHRAQLPLDMTLKDALSPKGDFVDFQGTQIHVNGWCKRFLFSPDLLELPIGTLSGGERARIAIAHLMLQPADVLLLDEPTNDLDIPTLETLEDSLLEFPGAIVLITHDRCMLNKVCNEVIALGNPEKVGFFSDYAQWESHQKQFSLQGLPKSPKEAEKKDSSSISYRQKKERDAVEAKIMKLEEEVRALNHLLEEKEIAENPQKLSEVCIAIGLVETQITQLYLRWEEIS